MIRPEVADELRAVLGHPDQPLEISDAELDERTKGSALRQNIEARLAFRDLGRDLAEAFALLQRAFASLARRCQRSA